MRYLQHVQRDAATALSHTDIVLYVLCDHSTSMSQGNATVSFEQITGGVGIGVANAPVTTTIHLPPGKDPARQTALNTNFHARQNV